eukprot:TRINITY_DN687_c0_g1_i1.p1 TRINITY_DN687_c0_g1~~TRINITY_DN687_c0_g1_i1.p1  ORF type:complete len:378 (-),score=89.94 TRINITY_DN687_c0_g1_i1:103-1236(-)
MKKENDFLFDNSDPTNSFFSTLGYLFLYEKDGSWYHDSAKFENSDFIQMGEFNVGFVGLKKDRRTIVVIQTEKPFTHTFDKNVDKIFTGSTMCFILMEDSSIFAFSRPRYSSTNKIPNEICEFKIPTNFESLKGEDPNGNVSFISGGYYFAMIVLKNGKVLRIGQRNKEPILEEKDGFAVLDLPFVPKIVASGSNITSMICTDNKLWFLGSTFTFPESLGEVECYNLGCTAADTIISTNKGILYNGTRGENFYDREGKKHETETHGNFILVSKALPKDIQHVFCTYSSFHIFLKDGKVIHSNNFKDLQNLKAGSFNFLPCFNGYNHLWSIQTHQFFSSSFKKVVFNFVLSMKRFSQKTKVPKVLLIEIIKFLSKYYI